MSESVDFIVLTRFGVGVTDPAWFEHRFRLFEAITLPSLRRQSDIGFHWAIFVGPTPLAEVEARLGELLRDFPAQVSIIRAAQTSGCMASLRLPANPQPYRVTALIDDDDAWRIDTVATARALSEQWLREGRRRVGFTFERGYEWILSDLLDVDALAKSGRMIVRKAAIREYISPFHSMSCFVLSPSDSPFPSLARLHVSSGDVLLAEGYERVVVPRGPAWLYIRHHQADSAIRKAHDSATLDLSIEALSQDFGIDAKRTRALCEQSHAAAYAFKRTHKYEDKSSITFSLDAIPASLLTVTASPTGVWDVRPNEDYGIVGIEVRLVIHDDVQRGFCFNGRIPPNGSLIVELGQLPRHRRCRYKLQTFSDGRWRDVVPYKTVPFKD